MRLKPKRSSRTKIRYSVSGRPSAPFSRNTVRITAVPCQSDSTAKALAHASASHCRSPPSVRIKRIAASINVSTMPSRAFATV
jgi:hypothetical protein